MAKTVRTGLLITGDASGAVKATQLTRDELDKLNAKQRETGQASQALRERIGSVAEGLRTGATQAAKFGAAIAGVAAAGLARLTQQGLVTADALAKTSSRLGIASEELASLRVAAERTAAMANGAFDTALQRMVRRVQEASQGTGEAKGAIEALGLSAQALAQMSPDQQFRAIADAMTGVDEQGKRVALAFKLFDTEGVALVNTLRAGSAGLDAFTAKADVAGVTLDSLATAKVEAANDSMADLGMLVGGLSQQLAVNFSPLLQGVADRLFGVAEEAGGMGEVATQVFQAVIKGAGFVGDVIQGLSAVVKGVEIAFRAFGAGVLGTIELIARGYIELSNLIPNINVDPESNFLVQTGMRAREELAKARGELVAIANTPMASERLDDFVADATRKSDEMASRGVKDHDTMQGAITDTEDRVSDLGDTSEDSANQMERSFGQAAENTRNIIVDLVDGSISSFSDMTSRLKGAFGSMLTDMARGASNPIMMNLGMLGFGVGGAASAGASVPGAAGGGIGGIASGISGASSIGGLLAGGLAGLNGSLTNGILGVSNALTSVGLESAAKSLQLGAANLSSGFGGLAGGLGLSAGAGFAGSKLSDALGLSGEHSGIGSTIGGIGGAFLGGPLGAGIGSFIGSAIGGLVSKGPQVARLGVDTGGINTRGALAGTAFDAASGLQIQAVAMRAGQEGEKAAKALAERFGQIDEALTGALTAAGIDVDLSGVRLGGTQRSGRGFIGSDIKGGIDDASVTGAADTFVREWIQAVETELPDRVRRLMQTGVNATAEEMAQALEQALALDTLINLDVVGETRDALEALGREQGNLLDQYDRHVDRVLELAGDYDQSTESLGMLSEALREQKGFAADLAVAYQTLGDEIEGTFTSSIQSIRESLMGDEELFEFRRDEIRRLNAELSQTVDPGEINRITQQIDQLSRSAFGQLDESQQQALGGEFINFLERSNQLAQRQLDRGLEQLSEREAAVSQTIDFELSNQAAETQMAATMQFSEAVQQFVAGIQNVPGGFGGFQIPSLEAFAEVNR